MIFLLLVWIVLLNKSFVAAATDESNIYEIRKNETLKPDSTSKDEHGKWDVLFLRSFIGFAIHLIQILLAPLKLILNGTADVVDVIIPECKGLDTNRSFFSGALEDFKARVHLIYPGTKWCGPGDVASSYEDLGVKANTDKCCRAHDSCPQSIAAGKTKYGLKNTGLFTRSLCTCDEGFYNCLKYANSSVGQALGTTYFNILGPQCFELVNCTDPRIKCRNRQKEGTQYLWSDSPEY